MSNRGGGGRGDKSKYKILEELQDRNCPFFSTQHKSVEFESKRLRNVNEKVLFVIVSFLQNQFLCEHNIKTLSPIWRPKLNLPISFLILELRRKSNLSHLLDQPAISSKEYLAIIFNI